MRRRSVLTAAVAAGLGIAGRGFRPPAVRAGEGAFIGGAAGCNQVALIFNIGTGNEPALGILDTLAAYGVPATMFMMGWWIDAMPETARAIAEYGHPIGSHGNLPPELTLRSDDEIRADLWAAEEAFLRVLGFPPAPYLTGFAGASDARVDAIAAELGYLTVGWEVETGDWEPSVSAEMIYDRVIDGVHDGAIVQMHLEAAGSTYTTAVALPWIIEALLARDYNLVTIPEMVQGC